MTTFGKLRHLRQCSTADGHFAILAIDHRANLRTSLDKVVASPINDEEFRAFKQEIMAALLPHSSAVLTDPEFGFGAGIASGVIGGTVGLLSPLEVTNYDIHPSQRETAYIPNWGVEKIKRIGGTGVKLLLYYHPDAPTLEQKLATVRGIVADCAKYDIPFFLEPILYPLEAGDKLSNAERVAFTVSAARVFSEMGVDVLKLEFPLDVSESPDPATWTDALDQVDAACKVPWALLSAGVDFDTFALQTEYACKAGASGVMVGRALWSEAVGLGWAARADFLRGEAARRMRHLAALCAAHARPWTSYFDRVAPSGDWYQEY